MIYVVSDLHGYPLDRFQKLLRKGGFGEDDFLFILGDVVDRCGDGGVEMLEWLMYQPNAQLLLGNHEAMLLSCSFLFDEVTEESIGALDAGQMELFGNWCANGGDVTVKALGELNKRDPEAVADILDYLRELPLYETVEAGGKDCLLVHAGLENFSPDRRLSDYSADELIWASPRPGDSYFEDVLTVFGHTPTFSFGEKYRGKVFRTKTWMDIDAGAGFGCEPVLIRLDDMKAFRL